MISPQQVYDVRPRRYKRGVDRFAMLCHLVGSGTRGVSWGAMILLKHECFDLTIVLRKFRIKEHQDLC